MQGQSPVDWIGAPIDFTTHWVWTHASSPGLDHVVSVQDAGEDVVAGFCALPRGPAVDLAVVVPAPVRTVRVEDLGACEDLAQADLRRVVHFVPPCWSGEPVADGETLARAYRCAFTASIDASARVAWSRQWVHVTPRMPPTGYLDRVVDRRDEIVVKTKAGCPGGTERPTYDLALALDLPVRPVRFETAPRRRACPQVP